MITWIFSFVSYHWQFKPEKAILTRAAGGNIFFLRASSASGVEEAPVKRKAVTRYPEVMWGYSGYFGILAFFCLRYLKGGGAQEWVCDVTRLEEPASMKVTVNFGAVRVIVPCGKGDLPVKQLMDLAITRYKKATGKVSLLLPHFLSDQVFWGTFKNNWSKIRIKKNHKMICANFNTNTALWKDKSYQISGLFYYRTLFRHLCWT